MKDPDNIFEQYDPTNPVHNPAGYIAAKQAAIRDIERQAFESKRERLKDKPLHFAKLHIIYWLVIIALCFFVGFLFTL